jgi:hypothetical protein
MSRRTSTVLLFTTFLAACGSQPATTKTETVTVSAPLTQTETATASAVPSPAPPQSSRAAAPEPASETTIVSERCKKEVAKLLRDPQSAQFGDQVYTVLVAPDNDLKYVGDPPLAVRSYQSVGTARGRHGFGGMGDPFNSKCYVSFDASGQVIDGRTWAMERKEDMASLIAELQKYAAEVATPTTR